MKVRVCQVSLSTIDNDPRILRTISALETDGYEVIPIGYGHGLKATPMSLLQKLLLASRKFPSNFLPAHWAQASYWMKTENSTLHRLLLQYKPDIIHAHDWNTLPAAASAAKILGARLIYDSHEYAVGQRQHRLFWRLVYPAYIRDLEKKYIKSANCVITVSQGIAELLKNNYNLETHPTVLRSTPAYVKIPFREANPKQIVVHYHGIFTQGRGLANLIQSVPLWPERFRLRLTGWGQPPRVEAELVQLANQLGITHRITFAERVAHDWLISHASEADIGICFWDGDTPQTNYALPNKIFEYTMAGLMAITGPGVELKSFVERYKHGISLADNQPETLANMLKTLNADQVSTYKRRALEAGKSLCWEQEKDVLLAVYEQIVV